MTAKNNRPAQCPVCHAGGIQVRYPAAHDYVGGEPFTVMACGDCGVAFTHPVPADMAPYYPATYRAYRGPVLGVLDWLYRTKARQWTRMFDRAGSVLEIGCGPGIMLRAMRTLGWQVTGLERSEEAAAYGRREFGLDIVAGDIESLPPERRFDFIILFQVLEHMTDPNRIIAECFRRLSPGGRIAIAVPNFDSWQARFGGDMWLHLDIPRHLFHFSPRSLDRILTSAGFQDVDFRYTSFEHDPYGWVQTALNRMISPPNTLLRHLMRLPASKPKVGASVVVGGVLGAPSVALAMLSWAAGRGAIVSAMARRPLSDNGRRLSSPSPGGSITTCF